MLEKSQEYLRLALAAAAILVGLSVAYHYVIYVPQKDQVHELAVQSKADRDAQQLKEKQAADARVALGRRTNYRVCLSSAQNNYDNRWNSSCKTRSQEAGKNLTDCIARGTTEESCRSYYPQTPVNDCTLPNALGDDYDTMLKDDQQRCLDEARSDVLAPL